VLLVCYILEDLDRCSPSLYITPSLSCLAIGGKEKKVVEKVNKDAIFQSYERLPASELSRGNFIEYEEKLVIVVIEISRRFFFLSEFM
jgi:hypothetical protein